LDISGAPGSRHKNVKVSSNNNLTILSEMLNQCAKNVLLKVFDNFM